ncbi:MAG: tRNA (adenosine(37)-N6)-dimethylallyltransferase MiaA [Oscillospiraceae bacterium]
MADKAKIPLLVICGPTATGKTGVAIEMCKRLNGEVIGADSMQIYQNLNIGTAKPTCAEMQMAIHHLVDFLPPSKKLSVADYMQGANARIAEINGRGKLPIMVGGTGQYISSVVKGLHLTADKPDAALRQRLALQAETEGIQAIYNRLCEIDLMYAKTLHPNDKNRVLRAMELYLQTGITMSVQLENSVPSEKPYNDLIIGLTYSNRELLYENINKRVDIMVENGLLSEAKLVYENQNLYITAAQAIGYKELFPYFDGVMPLEECIIKLKQASRNYAKRQLTWFKRMDNINWITVDTENAVEKILELQGSVNG